jgi:hypothetical protein
MMENSKPSDDLAGSDSPHFAKDQQPEQYPAWEEVEAGRYMPRRVRGSCQGRALG